MEKCVYSLANNVHFKQILYSRKNQCWSFVECRRHLSSHVKSWEVLYTTLAFINRNLKDSGNQCWYPALLLCIGVFSATVERNKYISNWCIHLFFTLTVFSLQLLPLWHSNVKRNMMCNSLILIASLVPEQMSEFDVLEGMKRNEFD